MIDSTFIKKFPSLFVGHGSPMNAIEPNDITRTWERLGFELAGAKGIITVSAHWLTAGVQVTSHEINPLIYDFAGFPEELFEVQYQSKGSPDQSRKISAMLKDSQITENWGLDHGAWSVLMYLAKQPKMPIFQLSINKSWNLKEHFGFAASLSVLREQGYVILGSGNIVHNLRTISWSRPQPPPDWAIEFDNFVTLNIESRNFSALYEPRPEMQSLWRQAHPSLEHFIPLLYVLASSDEQETLSFPTVGFQNSSISMRSVKISSQPASLQKP